MASSRGTETQTTRRDSARRRWWLVLGFASLMILGITLLGSGLAGPTASAEGTDPIEPGPETTSTIDASPTSNPFPVTDTMTDTVLAVLQAYEQELARHPATNGLGPQEATTFGPVAIATHWSEVHLPLMLNPRRAGPAPTPTTRPLGNPADMANTIWPAPSIRVVPGMTLAYEVRAKNYGTGNANVARVTLPYNKSQMTVESTRITDPAREWVSDLTDTHVTVNFNNVAPGELRKATIIFRVKAGLVDASVISMRATTQWSDDRTGGSWSTNWAPVLVGKTNDSAPWVWLAVEPLGGYPGTTHQFFSDRFIPGEGVTTWLNTPNGVRSLDLKGIADSFGRVTLNFRSTGLTRGTYSLVVYGARSEMTSIATFYVW